METNRPQLRLCLLLLSIVANGVSGASILFFTGFSTYSHRLAIWPVVEQLAENGHNVTFLSPNPPKNPNPKVNEYVTPGFNEFFSDNAELMINQRKTGNQGSEFTALFGITYHYCEMFVKNKEIQQWFTQQKKFDLIFIDTLFNDCAFAFVHKHKAPFIFFSTSTIYMYHTEILGYMLETSWIPDVQAHFPQPMNFLQRVSNTLRPLAWYFARCYWFLPKIEALLRENLNLTDLPSLCEMESQASLYFVNTHFSIEFARSLPPLYVPIAGLHIKENKNQLLTKDMEEFIEGGEGGFMYMSFGTYAPIRKLPFETQQVIFDAIRSFPKTRFILKWEGERLEGMPANILTASWVPQQALLAHKGIQGFITHGGLLSIQEATHFGVPLIVFPVFADQDFNADIIHRTRRGIKLEIATISKSELQKAIQNLLTDPSYKSRMVETSRVYKDLPLKPLETAVWWTEFVLRNGNTSILKPLSMEQTWYQKRLLDVWGFIFSVVISIPILILLLLCKCFRKKPVDPVVVRNKKKLQ